MINKECFTTEWIAQKSIELKYNDKNLIEKVIRAFSLLEMLAASGCPFYFKGGTSLMLILGDGSPHTDYPLTSTSCVLQEQISRTI